MIQESINNIAVLPTHARVWAFQSSKPLTGEMRAEIDGQLTEFLSSWAAHGLSLMTAYEIRFDRFIIIAVDEEVAQATGCSIDGMMRTVQGIDSQYELDLLNRMKVAYRKGEDIVECDVNEFASMLANGEATSSTPVFNNVVQSVAELNEAWETTVDKSWHANLLP